MYMYNNHSISAIKRICIYKHVEITTLYTDMVKKKKKNERENTAFAGRVCNIYWKTSIMLNKYIYIYIY